MGRSKLTSDHSESTSKNSRPIASLSLDLDNQWVYMKTHGDKGWETYPSYFDILIPNVCELLDKLRLKITFFIVGQDAALEKNRDVLKLLTERGHEVGNHSFQHEYLLDSSFSDQIRRGVLETDELILRITGQKPAGFRGPGFTWNKNLIETLISNDYIYDASTLPMYIGPLARLYYFWTSRLSDEQKAERRGLYGSFQDGFRPVKPFLWQSDSNGFLLEVPVTTMPLIKIPFHLSYLLYISRFSESLMMLYLKMAVSLCKLMGIGPSFLLHSLDFLGGDQVPDLAFFPGMDLSREHKLKIFKLVISYLSRHYRLLPLGEHARSLLDNANLIRIHL